MTKPNFGDTVIVKFGQDHKEVVLKSGAKIMNRFGAFSHDEIVQLEYGSKLMGKEKFGHLLKFTPILWSKALANRTQIIYPCDMSLIISRLNITNGSVVVESGTGSGCLSHAIINALAPTGHLHTFEYNENRYNEAKVDFIRHRLDHMVTVSHQNVCENGFDLINVADVVFLDLPSPWDCITFSKQALKKDVLTRICVFSPCIEQIQKSCKALSENGFTNIKTFECLLYDHHIRSVEVPDITTGGKNEIGMFGRFTEQKSHTSFLLFAELECIHGLREMNANLFMLKRSVAVWNLFEVPLETPLSVKLIIQSDGYGEILLDISPLITTTGLYIQLENILNGNTLYYDGKRIEKSFKHLYEIGITGPTNKLYINNNI